MRAIREHINWTGRAPSEAARTRYRSLSPAARQHWIDRAGEYSRRHPDCHAESTRGTYWRIKLAAIAKLGGRCQGCDETNPLVLSVNHLNDNHRDERRNGNRSLTSGLGLYRGVMNGRVPIDDVDLRCLNCQLLYEYEQGNRRLPQSAEFKDLHDALRR